VNPPRAASPGRRVALLGAQAFSLGLMVAWVTIPANAIFLESYGAGALPWTYVAAAAAGGLATVGLTSAFRHRTLVSVIMRVLLALAAALAASFVALRTSGPWVSAFLLVLLPILIPVGFMFVVGQAGMLLDVRVLKARYGRVIAGFAMGFLAGGLAGPAALEVFGGADSLVALAAAVAGAFAVIVWYTQRCYPELSVAPDAHADAAEAEHRTRPSLRSLARNRYVVLLALFQVLSATESQWLDYLVYDRAAQRYTSSDALAEFISRFTAISYGADIVFLLCLAGLVLRRFGLRLGLALDAAVVLLIVVATIAFSAALGSASTIVFVLIVAARVSDLTLGDGAARASLGAAYQAVPTRERLAAQSAIEGLAVPVAIGLSGLVLILVRQTVGTEGVALHVLTSVVVLAWVVVAVLLFRDYRVNLLANLRHRTLDPAELVVDDANTLAAIERLIDSDNEREIRLGIQTLIDAGHPELTSQLVRLTADERVGVRSFALDCLLEVDSDAAARAARDGVDHSDAAIRAASVRALGAGGDAADAPVLAAHWADPHRDVRVAAAAALGRLGAVAATRELARDVQLLSTSDDPDDRVLAAEVLGACGASATLDRGVLASLLHDPDDRVVRAALGAVRLPDDAALLDDVARHVDNRRTSAAAVEALAAGGTVALGIVDRGLRDNARFTRFGRRQLVRVCAVMGGDDAAATLCGHLGHRDREVGLAVARALAAMPADPANHAAALLLDERAAETIRADLDAATHVLRAFCVFEHDPDCAMLSRALVDQLTLLQQRIVACLAIRYGAQNLAKVTFQLAQHDAHSHALAVEWMEVTFAGDDRAAAALVEPDLTAPERLRLLLREFSVPPLEPAAILRDIVADPGDVWRRPWLAACALAAISSRDEVDSTAFDLSIAPAVDGDELAVVHETLMGFRRRLEV
jgi:hypothetical protein